MELAIFLVAILAIVRASDATWCVCKSGLNDTALQKAIDYACGHGADCTPIMQNGICYNPNTVMAHCSYAVNSYYQKNNEESTACDFGGAAATTSTDPSTNGCTYPASTSAAAGSSSSTNSTSIQPSGSTYGLGPSSVPYNSNGGFRPETCHGMALSSSQRKRLIPLLHRLRPLNRKVNLLTALYVTLTVPISNFKYHYMKCVFKF